ncbi:MAG: GntR family transcriptional regulator [Alphaproteobacteria bacterium]|nr:GntR family transcriptional regulator [Alphaproteobacteria bacterium]
MLANLKLQDSGVPIYIQLREQIAAAVGRGDLKPGERLPTMREVSVALRIDLNTVQRAYGELAREGIITMVQGRGSFVADLPPVQRSAAADAAALAAVVAAQAQAMGVRLDDLAAALAALAHKQTGRVP